MHCRVGLHELCTYLPNWALLKVYSNESRIIVHNCMNTIITINHTLYSENVYTHHETEKYMVKYVFSYSYYSVLNELFTKHFLTQEEVSELARKERWEWKDCLAQALSLLSTKSAVVVQGACSVMEEHGYSTSAKDLQS